MKGNELISVIVDFGKGSKVIKTAKKHGVTGATVLLGKGTAHSYLLDLLDLTEVKKEIVLMLVNPTIVDETLEAIDKKFHLHKPNHGIAFTVPIASVLGVRESLAHHKAKEKQGGEEKMYNAIFVIVDKGRAEAVIDTAVAAGSKGGTIINGRGSGIHEQKMLFALPIEPEKEIVLILSEQASTEKIVEAINAELNISEPGMGVLFTVSVNKTIGLI